MVKRAMMRVSFLMMLAMTIAGCGEVGIGYVDGERVIDTPAIKAIQTAGEEKLTATEAEVEAEMSRVAGGSEEDKMKAQEAGQRKLAGVRQAYATQMKEKIDAAIASAIKDKKIEVVVEDRDKQMVIEGGIDITDEVVSKLQE